MKTPSISKQNKAEKTYPSEFKKWREYRLKIKELVKENSLVGKELTIEINNFKNNKKYKGQMDHMQNLAKSLDKLKYEIDLMENTIFLTEIAIGLTDGNEDIERLMLLREILK